MIRLFICFYIHFESDWTKGTVYIDAEVIQEIGATQRLLLIVSPAALYIYCHGPKQEKPTPPLLDLPTSSFGSYVPPWLKSCLTSPLRACP